MGLNNTRVILFLSETEVNECGEGGRTSENNKIKLKKKFEKYHVPDNGVTSPPFSTCLVQNHG